MFARLKRIEQKLDLLIRNIEAMSTTISANLQALETQIAQNTSVEGSAVTLIQGLAAQLQAALASGDDAALPALTQQLNASATALAAAIAANTPAAPSTPSTTAAP